MPQRDDATRLLLDFSSGDPAAADRLLPLVYDELKLIARRYTIRERDGHTLSPTDLVHEAYLKLVGGEGVRPVDRTHFIAVAARAMRQILVDYARRRNRKKHGGEMARVALLDIDTFVGESAVEFDLVAFDQALNALAQCDPSKARVVELRVFGGLSTAEIAGVIGMHRRTVQRYWGYAQLWLYRELFGKSSG